MLFPLITFPYVCRVIAPDGIGQVDFFNSIINYISLFTCLGIPMYAVREIARERSDVVKMNRTAVEILLLHSLLTLAGYVVVAILCLAVPQVQVNIPLFLILSLTIFLTAIGCEWFYQGIEDFKYITIRGIIVRLISVALLFLFVRSKTDLLYYGCYIVFGILGSNVFNFLRLRKFIHRDNILFSQLHIFRHVKPVLQTFAFIIVTSIYTQLNILLLGFLKTTLAVAYFATASKVMQMFMKLSSCLGTVMIPHASHMVAEKRMDEFKALIQKSYDFTLALSMPVTTALVVCAPSIILLICGDEFAPAILPSRIVAFNILLVGMSGVFGMQVLYPIGKMNIVITCCAIGAVTDLVLNLCLIPAFSFNGTAVAYVGAEAATTLSMLLIGRKYLPIRFFKRNHLYYFVSCLVMAVAVYAFSRLYGTETDRVALLIGQTVIGTAVYTLCLFLAKDELLMSVVSKITTKSGQ